MFKHILLPLDGSRLAECALPHTYALAKAFGARVTLLRVIEQGQSRDGVGTGDMVDWYLKKEEASAYLQSLVGRFRETQLEANFRILEGPPAQKVLEFARGECIDLMMLSSHGKSGLSPWCISSVAQKILFTANISTMIVRAYQSVQHAIEGLRYRKLLIPLDGSTRAEHFLPLAVALAQNTNAELLLTHIVRKPELPCRNTPGQADLDLVEAIVQRNEDAARNYLKQIQSRFNEGVRTRIVVSEDVALALHELIDEEEVDLILVSAHGQSAKPRWPFGSIATNLLSYGGVPILIVQDYSCEELELSPAEQNILERKGH